jgi:RsiW-degrading membrane proteinase PrsW (M82 family)
VPAPAILTPVLATLRWLLAALLPVALGGVLVRAASRTDARREPPALVATTFALGAAAAGIATLLIGRAASLTGLDVRVSEAGQGGALIFLFFVVAPLHEAGKVAAAWPALLLKHVDEPYDGVVYAAASALGFSSVLCAVVLREHPTGALWVARALLALPAEVFVACLWGYALGRAKHAKGGVSLFPGAFALAVGIHGLYAYFVYGRGPGALLAVTPLLAAMGTIAWLLGRDLRARPVRSPSSKKTGRLSSMRPPPSLSAVRAALKKADEPVKLRWIVYGAFVTLGGMIAGIAAGIVAAHALRIDLSAVNEHDVRAASPVLLLGVGLLASFPTSGWLIARGAGVRTLLEPALATVLALVMTLVGLGFAAPFTVVFALALSPVAWLLSCIGAWAGRLA